MIHVLHVSTPLTWRGGEQQVFNLVKYQHHSKEIIPFVLCPEGSELSVKLRQEGVKVHTYSTAGILRLGVAKELKRISAEENINLIHTHDSHAHTAAVLSASVFRNPLPVIVHRRVDFPVSSSPFSRWKYNHPSVKRIICVSEMILKITAPALKNSALLAVVYSGVDPDRYQQKPVKNTIREEFKISNDYYLVGNLSALADHKDYPTFINAAERILKQDTRVKFIIAGDGPEKENILTLLQRKNLEQDFILTGFRKDVPDIMNSLDVFLMTSKTEGLGTILIEAFMAGIPVVATNAGGIPELVKNGETGLQCPVADADCLAASVTRLLNDPSLRIELSNKARTFAQQFSHRNTAEKTLQVYRSVLTENESSSPAEAHS